MSDFKDYEDAGWKLCAIPRGEKGPTGAGWNSRHELPADGQNGGVLLSLSGLCTIDIDHLELAAGWLAMRGIDLEQLASDPSAVRIVSGRPGSAKLVYRTPFGLPLQSKKVILEHQGAKTVALEFRCASAAGTSLQDVAPPSIHPSGSVYEWRGDWRNIPELPTELFDLWSQLIEETNSRQIPTGEGTLPTNLEEIRQALFAIPADVSRQEWIEVGMALHYAAIELDCVQEAFDLWDSWSSSATAKYKAAEMEGQWRSFKLRDDGIKTGTLFHHAILHGWRRPLPDLQQFFKPVETTVKDAVERITPLGASPEIDLSVWPPALVRRAEEVAAEVGCDITVPLVAGLAAVSAAVDKRTTLTITPTWKVPPTVWLMTIGEPADKKTPGSKPMFVPLRQLEIEDKPRHAAEMMQWVGKEARYAAEMKAFREWQTSPEAMMPNAVPPVMGGLPPEPQSLRLFIQDATTQKVVSMSVGRERGFLLWLDEMNRWLTKLSDPRTTDDRGCWIQGYETGPYTMDRQGAGTIAVENMALSIYGNCQPAVFRNTVGAASTDGIAQRFMPVILNAKKNAMWQHAVPSFASSASEYEGLIRRTFSLPVTDYTLSPEAMAHFRKFSEWMLLIRKLERLQRQAESYQTALGKMEGNCARVMQLFHVMNDPYNPVISGETARNAILVMQQFFIPNLRHAFLEVASQRDMLGKVVTEFVVQCSGVRPTLSLAEVRAGVKTFLDREKRDPAQAERSLRIIMDELALMQYVQLVHDHPRYPSWAVNPTLADSFKEEREEIIKTKQAAIEQLSANLHAAGCIPEPSLGRNAIGYDSLKPSQSVI
jgi:hypothetical protein